MGDVSSVEIRLNAGKPACILDGVLALSSIGPLLSHRLARHWPVWIARSLWPLIDSDNVYRRNPEYLDQGHRNEPDENVATAEALSDWHALWISGRLDGRFHWVGDVRHESNLPDDLDDMFTQRFEVLAAALADRLAPDDDGDAVAAYSWRNTCASEAVALAAALSDRAAVIVTLKSKDESTPAIIHMLKRMDIETRRLPANNSGRMPLELPDLVLVGMPPLLVDPPQLIAIHVSAPKALTLPWGPGGAALWGDGADLARPFGPPPNPWAGATAAWHPLA